MLTIIDHFLVKKGKKDGLYNIGTYGQGVGDRKSSQKIKRTVWEETINLLIGYFPGRNKRSIADNTLDTE